MREPITSKEQFLRLSESGLLGNRMPSWRTMEDAARDGYFGPFMIRDRTPNSPYMRPDVDWADVPGVIASLFRLGADPSRLYLTHMTPGAGRLLNAELCERPGGIFMHYSTAQTHLRAALDNDGRHAHGTAARSILRGVSMPEQHG